MSRDDTERTDDAAFTNPEARRRLAHARDVLLDELRRGEDDPDVPEEAGPPDHDPDGPTTGQTEIPPPA